MITAYATAFGGALILGGRLADLFGRRRIFIAGLLAFGLTSLACALAPSPIVLVVSRAGQGLSAAVLAPAALALLTTTFSEGAERNRALGIFGSATAMGFVSGQILGGVLTDFATWRSIFLINVPVAVVGTLLAVRALAPDGVIADRRIPDVLGAVIVTAAMALLVWAPTRGAGQGWLSVGFLAPIGMAIALLLAFVVVELRVPRPLVRLSMLRSRWLAGTYVATGVTGILNGAVVLLCTLFLQQVHGYDPLHAGLAFVPTGIAGVVVATRFAGPLITRFGVRTVLGGASLLSAGVVAGVSQLPSDGSYLRLLPWLIGIGATFTTAAVATTVAISSGVAPGEQGMAAALRQTAFQVGVALGVAVLLSIAASYTSTSLSAPNPPSRAAALTSGYRVALLILSVISAVGGLTALVTRVAARCRSQPRHCDSPLPAPEPRPPSGGPAGVDVRLVLPGRYATAFWPKCSPVHVCGSPITPSADASVDSITRRISRSPVSMTACLRLALATDVEPHVDHVTRHGLCLSDLAVPRSS